MINGTVTVEWRGVLAEIVYTRFENGEVEFWFADQRLNDPPIKLTAVERRDLRLEALAASWRQAGA